MTFQQLTYVVEISKCGSINKAAHKLFLSQSGISTAVRELEEELGIKFFVRSNRGVEFTPEGRRRARSFWAMQSRCWSRSSGSKVCTANPAAPLHRCISAFPPSGIPLLRTLSWKCSSKTRKTATNIH